MTIMIHAFLCEAHNLLSVRNMRNSNRLSTTPHTQDTETGSPCLEPGHTMMWLLGASTISYYQEMTTEKHSTVLGPYDRAERLDDKEPLPHPTRSPITALRTFFGIAMLAGTCIVSIPSLSSAAELFPYTPPSPSQQHSVERQPAAKPQLSSEDLERISRIATQARTLESSKRIQLKNSIQRNLDDAVANGKLTQGKYFSQLLRQID
jgi:hypothetical protein